VLQEAPDQLLCAQGHLLVATGGGVGVGEGDRAIGDLEQALERARDRQPAIEPFVLAAKRLT
jgi:hypothetical protein